MKIRSNFSSVDLKVDALDYIFTEWLVRNHLYRKFSKNLREDRPDIESPRAYIRARIYDCVVKRDGDCSSLIETAFFFDGTLEGHLFWWNAATRWRNFLRSYINF
jgi:hypothetical protein